MSINILLKFIISYFSQKESIHINLWREIRISKRKELDIFGTWSGGHSPFWTEYRLLVGIRHHQGLEVQSYQSHCVFGGVETQHYLFQSKVSYDNERETFDSDNRQMTKLLVLLFNQKIRKLLLENIESELKYRVQWLLWHLDEIIMPHRIKFFSKPKSDSIKIL